MIARYMDFSRVCKALLLTMALPALTTSIAYAKDSQDQTVDPEVLKRIAPVGRVNIATESTATENAAAAPASNKGDQGKSTYDAVCAACHGAGLAGAPKLGDKSAWAERIAQGIDTLYDHAVKGFQGKSGMMMPPKGGSDRPDAEIKAAVDYMVGASK
jgi:cytochrome c5